MSDRWFAHSGDLGDIIYALPTIRAMGGGSLELYNRPNATRMQMTLERVELIRPLLLLQPYIEAVHFMEPSRARDHDLNGFRDHSGNYPRNLADMHLGTHGMGFEHRYSAWLSVDRPELRAAVVFARSPRYHCDRFPWQRIFQKYGHKAVFVGLADEYDAFTQEVGRVPYAQTTNLLEVARIIAGSDLYIGNQSCPSAIAEGLKHSMILEVYPHMPNCEFHRLGKIHAWDERIELPEIVNQNPKP